MKDLEKIQSWIAESRKITDAATEGPWQEVAESGDWWIDAEGTQVLATIGGDDEFYLKQHDVDFIAHSRTAHDRALKALEHAIGLLESACSNGYLARRDTDEEFEKIAKILEDE